jgi:hypothetical protein
MAVTGADQIRTALARCEALVLQGQELPDPTEIALAQHRVNDLLLNLPSDAGGQAPGKWETLDQATQHSLTKKLEALLDELNIRVSPTGLRGSRMLMSSDPAPSWVVLLLLVMALAGTAAVLTSVVDLWPEAHQGTGSSTQRQSAFALAKEVAEQSSREVQRLQTARDTAAEALETAKTQGQEATISTASAAFETATRQMQFARDLAEQRWAAAIELENTLGPPHRTVILMVVLLGALGGFIHLASSLAMYVGNRDLKRSWIVYYLVTPAQGAALAPLLFLLLTSAVLSPQSAPGGDTDNLNLTAIYAFAGLTGLFSKQAIHKLADVFDTLFKDIDGKDATKDRVAKT